MKLQFNEKEHKYFVGRGKNKILFTSVTQFVHKFFPPFEAKKIARKLAKIPRNKFQKRGVRYFLKEWKERSQHGTRIHNAMEDYINNGDIGKVQEEDVGKISQGVGWLQLNVKDMAISSEYRIHDIKLKLAGTIDLLIEHDDKSITLVDWKTNKEIKQKGFNKKSKALPPIDELDDCNYNQYTLQLSLYGYLMERKGYTIKALKLVHLKDAAFVEYNIDYRKDLIEELIEYERTNEIKSS